MPKLSDSFVPKLPEPGDRQRKLEVFVGSWHAEGSSYGDGQREDDPLASAVPWTSDESYEWLPGGFFLLHRWDAVAGKRVFKGTEIIGYDDAAGRYFTHLFDNVGNHVTYEAVVKGDGWKFKSEATRVTATAKDADHVRFYWEWRNDGSDWLPLCDRVATRIK